MFLISDIFCIFVVENQLVTNIKDIIIRISGQKLNYFILTDEFYKVFDTLNAGKLLLVKIDKSAN